MYIYYLLNYIWMNIGWGLINLSHLLSELEKKRKKKKGEIQVHNMNLISHGTRKD